MRTKTGDGGTRICWPRCAGPQLAVLSGGQEGLRKPRDPEIPERTITPRFALFKILVLRKGAESTWWGNCPGGGSESLEVQREEKNRKAGWGRRRRVAVKFTLMGILGGTDRSIYTAISLVFLPLGPPHTSWVSISNGAFVVVGI